MHGTAVVYMQACKASTQKQACKAAAAVEVQVPGTWYCTRYRYKRIILQLPLYSLKFLPGTWYPFTGMYYEYYCSRGMTLRLFWRAIFLEVHPL